MSVCFNTCSSCEEQRAQSRRVTFCKTVSIHAPLARSNDRAVCHRDVQAMGFNTCSSCEEQLECEGFYQIPTLFQYMLLLRGATDPANRVVSYYLFQYMLLLRGATDEGEVRLPYNSVSIHAPLARSNRGHLRETVDLRHVSIHAPLARSNSSSRLNKRSSFLFQYMLLLRGATNWPF